MVDLGLGVVTQGKFIAPMPGRNPRFKGPWSHDALRDGGGVSTGISCTGDIPMISGAAPELGLVLFLSRIYSHSDPIGAY